MPAYSLLWVYHRTNQQRFLINCNTHEVAIGYVGVAVSECLVGGGAVACCDLVDRSTVTAAIGWSYWRGGSG